MLRDDFSDLEMQRLNKLEQLRAMGQEPYPLRSYKSHTNASAVALLKSRSGRQRVPLRWFGWQVRDPQYGQAQLRAYRRPHRKIQLLMRVNEIGAEKLDEFVRFYDLGDFIEASGQMMRTRRGEVTLQVQDFRMLSKALLPLPADKDETVDGEVVRHAQLTDPETRYRRRYVDLAVNPEVREIFRVRAETVKAIRAFLDERDFMEVETPILQPIYGGAAARPFTTYHNQLHQELFLRISFELYLKRLLVGG